MKSVAFLHNTIPPYRVELFNRLTIREEFTLVLFDKYATGRMWNSPDLEGVQAVHSISRLSIFDKNIIYAIDWSWENYDVLILPDDKSLVIYYLLNIKSLRKKEIIWWSGAINCTFISRFILLNYFLRNLLDLTRKFILYKSSDKFLTYGPNSSQYVRKLSKSDNIYEGIQMLDYPLITRKSRRKNIGFIGYYSKRKGFELLLECTKILKIRCMLNYSWLVTKNLRKLKIKISPI